MKDTKKAKVEHTINSKKTHHEAPRIEKAEINKDNRSALVTGRFRLSDAMDLAQIVYWELDWSTETFIFNDAFYAFHGTSAEVEGGYRMPTEEYVKRFVHPDDVMILAQEAEKIMSGMEPEYVVDMEHRIIRRDGEVRYILSRTRGVRNGSGRITRSYGTNQDITERKRSEETLIKSELQYRSLFENMLDGLAYCRMIYDNQGDPVDFVFLQVNTAFGKQTGLENVVGKKATEIIKGIREAHPELFMMCSRVAAEGRPERLEIELQPMNLWLSLSIYSNEREHFIALCDNITKRKQAEETLRMSEARFRAVFECAGIGMIVFGLDGLILRVNQALCDILGYSEEEVLARTLQDITYPEDIDNSLEHRNRLLDDQFNYYQLENRYFHKDGYMVWVLESVSLIRDVRGYPMYFIAHIEDMTDQKILKDKLETISIMDELTGLYNRRGFLTLCEQQLRLSLRTNQYSTLFFIDLDRMKWINDTLGHHEGDMALVTVAQILKDTFREPDIIGRMGGDEFAVLAHGVRDVLPITSRLKTNIDKLNEGNVHPWSLSLSVGTANCEPVESNSLESLIALADASMYEEKRKKKIAANC